MRAAIFLDRDGTLNARPAEHEYVTRVEDFIWISDAQAALRSLAQCWPLVIVSNQRGVARGCVTPATLDRIGMLIRHALGEYESALVGCYYCPHNSDCQCRKPAPGLLLAAAREHNLDLANSWMIGDDETDVVAGQRAGCRTIRLSEVAVETTADYQSLNLAQATQWLLATHQPRHDK
jgi:D-glycero-D-manno-heptose 1,7-bisphosphate phosphatase